ncbi:MAG: regulator of protease activity HflC (stomatin/prohibitin superfamily) [Cyclobacteriaceae bacterium]|jgi:regulator of protease activity HflC (stomatin/prohibitin superfamily)
MDNRKYLPLIIILIVSLIVVVTFSNKMFLTIEAGEAGILFKPFTDGLKKDVVYGQGFHMIAPWNSMYLYNVKEQKAEESMDILDKNGLSINVDITIRFNPIPTRIGYLHERFGKAYIGSLVIPEVRSAVRQVMGRYTAEEIYSTKRAEVETTIIQETDKTLSNENNNILMNALLIRSINLPKNIKNAIENKLQQEQEALAYEYKLNKERSEAERKQIAADGEAIANKIINSSLTDNLLKMRGIEATQELSKSPNSKIIIIGGGKDGLPLILNAN